MSCLRHVAIATRITVLTFLPIIHPLLYAGNPDSGVPDHNGLYVGAVISLVAVSMVPLVWRLGSGQHGALLDGALVTFVIAFFLYMAFRKERQIQPRDCWRTQPSPSQSDQEHHGSR